MIHDDNPFLDSPDQRDPVRRFRGRLVAPVTIVTAGTEHIRVGLTVSSLSVIEGHPGLVQLVVGPTTDLWAAVEDSARFVIHVCREIDRHRAEVFAGLRPSPGGVFAGLETTHSEWGPVINELPDRAFCTLVDILELGSAGVATGHIDRIEASDLTAPLVYFRGRYRSLGS